MPESEPVAPSIGFALTREPQALRRPRLRDAAGEVSVPGYDALARDGELSLRIADTMVCNVSTRKYERVVHRCADEPGISKSAVSRRLATMKLCIRMQK